MEEISFDDVEEVINNFQGLNKTMHYMMMEKQKSLIYHRSNKVIIYVAESSKH